MDTNRTDQKRDPETGDWISDLKPGASQEAKQDKRSEDSFPASDPAVKTGVTGFVPVPDETEAAVEGSAEATARDAREDLPRQG
ncbi:hypothetical protein ACE7GA_25535 [Roseomonas sp. CCTCC AB2023176]|uniref:hypothetical protein n=1 Tax=Roseomonas sp. CCTCC AB2023176 TaxID=3342640 RepID=UPI0035DE7669